MGFLIEFARESRTTTTTVSCKLLASVWRALATCNSLQIERAPNYYENEGKLSIEIILCEKVLLGPDLESKKDGMDAD